MTFSTIASGNPFFYILYFNEELLFSFNSVVAVVLVITSATRRWAGAPCTFIGHLGIQCGTTEVNRFCFLNDTVTEMTILKGGIGLPPFLEIFGEHW